MIGCGGGPLFDRGVYNVASLTGLLGPAQRVMAMTGAAIPERQVNGEKVRIETEDNAHVLEIMLKAQESGRTGRAVDIESSFAPAEFFGQLELRQEHRIHDRSRAE